MNHLKNFYSIIDKDRIDIALILGHIKTILKPLYLEDTVKQIDKSLNSEEFSDNEIILNEEESKCVMLIDKVLNKSKKTRTCIEKEREELNKELQLELNSESTNDIPVLKNILEDVGRLEEPTFENVSASYVTKSQLDQYNSLIKDSNRNNSCSNRNKKLSFTPAHVNAPYKTNPGTKKPCSSNYNHPTKSKCTNSRLATQKMSSNDKVTHKICFDNNLEIKGNLVKAKTSSEGELKTFNHSSIKLKNNLGTNPPMVSYIKKSDGDVQDDAPKPANLIYFTDYCHLLKMPEPYVTSKQKNELNRSKLKCLEMKSLNNLPQTKFVNLLQNHFVRSSSSNSYTRLIKKKLDLIFVNQQILSMLTEIKDKQQPLLGTCLKRIFKNNEKVFAQLTKGRSFPEHTACREVPQDIFHEWCNMYSCNCVAYNDLKQLIDLQNLNEKLSLLHLDLFMMSLLQEYLKSFKQLPPDDRYVYSVYRAMHSMVHSDGRRFPCIVRHEENNISR